MLVTTTLTTVKLEEQKAMMDNPRAHLPSMIIHQVRMLAAQPKARQDHRGKWSIG